MNRKGKGVTSDMSERKWTRRTWDGRLEILNYPFSDKALTSLGKDSAMALANEIFATYHTIAPPKQWEGKLWVQIVTGNATYRILCVSVADAMGTMNGLADLIDSGKCIRRMLRAGPDYTFPPKYTVIPAASVKLVSMCEVEEVKR